MFVEDIKNDCLNIRQIRKEDVFTRRHEGSSMTVITLYMISIACFLVSISICMLLNMYGWLYYIDVIGLCATGIAMTHYILFRG